MKFAICNETFQDWPLEKAFSLAAECGYTGIEIAPFTLGAAAGEITVAQRRAVRQAAEAGGLEVVGLHWLLAKTEGLHLTSPEADTRRRTVEYLKELIWLCADLGGRILVFGSPQQRNLLPGVTKNQADDYTLQALDALLIVLEQSGAVLALEPLGPVETNYLNTAADAAELIHRLAAPQVRLHLDCKAMTSEAEPIPELLARHASILAHIHANDPNRQGPGFGKLDFVPIFKALKQIDYQGWVSVEVFDYSPGVERLARESILYMQECSKS
ncbi:MAG: sugar phosphate isomerase/epimerase [Pirellulales bacterium]|nr:sugar phosphate isomerase/epimerase [Pirellulales bacterium]